MVSNPWLLSKSLDEKIPNLIDVIQRYASCRLIYNHKMKKQLINYLILFVILLVGALRSFSQAEKKAEKIVADEKVIDEIEAQGVGNHYVIPKELWPPFLVESLANPPIYDKRDRVTLQLANGEFTVSQALPIKWGPKTDGQKKYLKINIADGFATPSDWIYYIFPCGERTVFIVKGRLWNIVGDINDPIRLVYMKNKGLVYLGGKGKVLDFSDKQVFDTELAKDKK